MAQGDWDARDLTVRPDEIPGCLIFCDANEIAGAHGDPISQWDDLSGNANHLTQGTGSLQPTIADGELGNGARCVRFNDDYFNLPNVSGESAYEAMILLKIDNDPSLNVNQSGLWRFGPSGPSNATQWTQASTGNLYENAFSTVQRSIGNPSQSLTNWHIWNPMGSASAWQGRLDGNLVQNIGSNTVSFPTDPTLGYENYNSGSIDLYLRGEIAAFVLYNRTLTDTERAAVFSWFDRRRGPFL